MSKTTEVMREALIEIKRLRQANEVLTAKASVLDIFALTLQPRQYQEQGMTMRVDPAWEMEKHLDELIQQEKVTGRLSPRPQYGPDYGEAQAGEINKI